jgi:hypothetical protein
MKLTSLEETGILLNIRRPTPSLHTVVPEASDRPTLGETDNHTPHVYYELNTNDCPQKPKPPFDGWYNAQQK